LKNEKRTDTITTPAIEKMKPKLSPIFQKTGNWNPTGIVTWKKMQAETGGSH
jgi:hypothetical protein